MSLARRRKEDIDRYRNICTQAVDAIFLEDIRAKRIIEANEYAAALTGYSRNELIGMSIFDLHPEGEERRLIDLFHNLEKTGELRNIDDTHIRRRDGRVIPIDLSESFLKIDGESIGMSIVRDISERKRIEAELAERNEDLEILSKIALEIASGLELDKVLKLITEYGVALSDADAGAIAMVDPETGSITYPFAAKMPPEIFDVVVARGQGLAGRVIETRQPIVVRDYPAFPGAVKEFVEAGVIEVAAVPLISKGVAVGAFGVFMLSRDRHFTDRQVRLLEGVGRQAGVAIENARLFAIEHREREALFALESISQAALTIFDVGQLMEAIISSMLESMGICCGSIFLVEDGWLVVRASVGVNTLQVGARVRFGEGFAGQVGASGRVIAVSDLKGYPLPPEETPERLSKSMIGIPLKVRGRILGVARFDTMQRHDFTRDEIRLFATLADRAAVAIENARLFAAEKRRAEETSALMHLTSDLLSILDVSELLRHVAEQAVNLVDAQIGFVPTLSNEELLGIRERYDVVDGWRPVELEWKVGEGVPGHVLKTGDMVVVDDAKKSPLTSKAMVLKLGIRNLIAVPIITRGGDFIAVVVVANKRGIAPFTGRDTELLRAITGQASIGFENARLYEDQHHIAQTLQQSLLPQELPEIPNTELGVSYTSATIAATAGGDFYDVIKLPDQRIAVLIGDVSGKGVEAATRSAMTRFLVKALAFENPEPAGVLEKVNKVLYRETKLDEFVTMFFGVFDPKTGRLIYSNAGHPPPLTCGPVLCAPLDGRQEMVSGAFLETTYTNGEVEFAPESGLVLYTDGLIEARRGNELFGERRLKRIISERTGAGAQELASSIFEEVKAFSGGRLADDIAIVVIKRF
ncbi:MAG: GAF domain-containing protein [Actinobacteria bacterium]|nr:GAF domain-containing protein [Actinomycetota bacterium]